jgi:hypothetical protein
VIGDELANAAVVRTFPSELFDGAMDNSVRLIVEPVGGPDAGNAPVRFDERG